MTSATVSDLPEASMKGCSRRSSEHGGPAPGRLRHPARASMKGCSRRSSELEGRRDRHHLASAASMKGCSRRSSETSSAATARPVCVASMKGCSRRSSEPGYRRANMHLAQASMKGCSRRSSEQRAGGRFISSGQSASMKGCSRRSSEPRRVRQGRRQLRASMKGCSRRSSEWRTSPTGDMLIGGLDEGLLPEEQREPHATTSADLQQRGTTRSLQREPSPIGP